MYLANRQWFLELREEERDHLRASLMPTAQMRQLVRDYEARILQDPARYGIELLQPDKQQLQAWRDATANNQRQLVDAIGGESEKISKRLVQAKRAFRQQPAAGL